MVEMLLMMRVVSVEDTSDNTIESFIVVNFGFVLTMSAVIPVKPLDTTR
jgi:hypothetical protein